MLTASKALEISKNAEETLNALKVQAKTEEEKRNKEIAFKELREIEGRIERYAKLGEYNLNYLVEWKKYGLLSDTISRDLYSLLSQNGFTLSIDFVYNGTMLYISWEA